MEKSEIQKMREEEFNFLIEELKRIDAQIKTIKYGGTKDAVEADIKLWELRGKIKEKIDMFINNYPALFK